ncbi:hypothetical protein THI4931_24310 [Pandoraea sputorum]|nr:hypothetical protein THI4931_24310 [Pandoraea sputorum]
MADIGPSAATEVTELTGAAEASIGEEAPRDTAAFDERPSRIASAMANLPNIAVARLTTCTPAHPA